jgi:MarR family transcriptional regulator, transcriptional regulator for hemolysin
MPKLDLSNSLGSLIFLASKSMERAAEHEMKKELGLTPSQWKIILSLSLFDGISQKELADKIYVDGSTLVPIIDKMEEGGLVERKPDPKDRRNNRLFLTKKAGSAVDSIIEIIMQLRKKLYKGMSQGEEEVIRIALQKIIDNANNSVNMAKNS